MYRNNPKFTNNQAFLLRQLANCLGDIGEECANDENFNQEFKDMDVIKMPADNAHIKLIRIVQAIQAKPSNRL